jgi:PTS system mannose-specific IID component
MAEATKTVQTGDIRRVTLGDRKSVWWRLTFLQGSWNYERMQNGGWCYSMIPALKRLYGDKPEELKAALKRHLEYYNTTPFMSAPILGITMSLEEERAAGQNVDDAAIQGVKIGMMGPFAGVGDPIFWGTARPVFGAFAASFALNGSILGPILFFVLWNAFRLVFTWYTQEAGYKLGMNITKDLSGGLMKKVTTAASILGMFIMGVLVPRWTTMKFPLVVSSAPVSVGGYADWASLANELKGGINTQSVTDFANTILKVAGGTLKASSTNVQTLSDIFNTLLPGLMPLLLTLLLCSLLKKKASPIVLILCLFVFGILMYVLGIMS